MKQLNFDAYRFSISWSRIFPGSLQLFTCSFLTDLVNSSRTDSELFSLLDGEGKVNPQGVEYYNNMINYLLQQGMTVFLNTVLISGCIYWH